ncbi:hypothetical protein CH380_10800 [Leptospira adleri]|uniref:Uncharacterized protein n=1 Tax=Leptospira adleri TaxID=2023186 RepID=A0A2M9YP15_9LEPT|nr:hypothetical protein CH380_10800 [Leptospira adleri]PJZ63905.1 hypothetical protein CH376_00310 [Leptospira adleri]
MQEFLHSLRKNSVRNKKNQVTQKSKFCESSHTKRKDVDFVELGVFVFKSSMGVPTFSMEIGLCKGRGRSDHSNPLKEDSSKTRD